MTPAAIVLTSATCTLAGTILSGPVALAILARTRPQPAWVDAATFAANYHPIQSVPYFAGLLLVGGFVSLVAALHRLATEAQRARTGIAVAFVGAFGAMIFTNYAIQTTFVPALLATARAEGVVLAGNLTMVNPNSLGWALEMWGYGVLGVATWLVAPVLRSLRHGQITAALFVVNGAVSVLGALITAFQPSWVLSSVGIFFFAFWNLLVIAMALLAMLGIWQAASRVPPNAWS